MAKGQQAQPQEPASRSGSARVLTRVSWEERDLARRTKGEVAADHSRLVARPTTAPAKHRLLASASAPNASLSKTFSVSRPKTAAASASEPNVASGADDDDWLSDLNSDSDASEDETKLTAMERRAPERLKRRYLKECKQQDCVPVSYLKSRLGDAEIVMNNHGLGPKGTRALALILKGSMELKKLVLRGNFISCAGVVALCDAFSECDELQILDLSENHIGTQGMEALAAFFAENGTVRELTLEKNNLLDMHATNLAQSLKESSSIQALRLASNRLGDLAAHRFADMLSANDSLLELDLNWNCISASGSIALGRALAANGRLLRLLLSHNGIEDRGAAGLASGLRDNSTLVELTLDGNRIKDAGAKALAAALAVNTSLQKLSLGHNPIGNEGMAAILEAIRSNPRLPLTSFNIDGIPLDANNKKLLQEIMEDRPELQVVVLGVEHSADEREQLMARLRELSLKYPGRKKIQSTGFSSDWTPEEAWARGFNPDGSPRMDEEWLLKQAAAFNPLWTEEEAARHGFNPDGTRMANPVGGDGDGTDLDASLFPPISSDSDSSEYDSDDPGSQRRRQRKLLRRRDRELRRQFRMSYPNLADPMAVLEQYVDEHKLRLVDLFFRMDKNRDGTITEQEMDHAIEEYQLNLNEIQREELISRMDIDGDGELNYHELCEGRRQFAEKQHRADPRWTTKFEKEDEDAEEEDGGDGDDDDDDDDDED